MIFIFLPKISVFFLPFFLTLELCVHIVNRSSQYGIRCQVFAIVCISVGAEEFKNIKKVLKMLTGKLSRREREKLRQRSDMLKAALKLFSKNGYHNVSMRTIAQKAEFAIGTIYKFFRNKEDLYRALIMEHADEFHDALVKAIEEPGNEIGKIKNYIKVKGDIFTSKVSIVKLYFAETHGTGFNFKTGIDRKIREQHKKTLDILASVFKDGIENGIFIQGNDPYCLALAIDAMTNAFLFLWLENPDEHSYSENAESILDMFLKGLCNKT